MGPPGFLEIPIGNHHFLVAMLVLGSVFIKSDLMVFGHPKDSFLSENKIIDPKNQLSLQWRGLSLSCYSRVFFGVLKMTQVYQVISAS